MSARGKLFIISGPSGSGKSTLIRQIIKDLEGFEKSVSVTTRPPRKNEAHGKQYYFLSDGQFKKMADNGELLEWAPYAGYLYGTPLKFVMDRLSSGINVILEIEVQGAMKVMETMDDAYSVFIATTTPKELKERLLKRGTDGMEDIENRIRIALRELQFKKYYDCIIVNNNYNEALANLKEVLLMQKGG
ncbi:MAG: guanylate kinase [Actinobacteria bacterium]|nr:guanylate kinase [Actinomycetota bacterium]